MTRIKAEYLFVNTVQPYWVECVITGQTDDQIFHLVFQNPFNGEWCERMAGLDKVRFNNPNPF